MALSIAQQNQALEALTVYFLNQGITISSATQDTILEVFTQQEIVFNPDLKEIGKNLVAIATKQLEEDQLRAELIKWAQLYPQHEAEASVASRKIHAAQPKGILRCLRNQQQPGTVWCEDLDIQIGLQGLMIPPENITRGGRYILPPVSLLDSHALADRLRAVLAKNIQDEIRLCIPVAYMGHWRLAVVDVVQNKVFHAKLWDSLDHPTLQDDPAFGAFKQQLKQVQPKLKDEDIEAHAENIQPNFWGCGDQVTQKAIKETDYQDLSAGLIAIRDANDPHALRAAMVAQIKQNHPILRLTQEEKVSFFSKDVSGHLEAQEEHRNEFDSLLAQKFHNLINNSQPGENEDQLFEKARDEVYEELASKLQLPKPKS
jgi:hypothetical protein